MFCSPRQNQTPSEKDTIKKIGSYLFRYSQILGSGNFSTVYSGVDENTGRQIAVKVVKMSSLKSKTALKLLENQILILKDLDNPYVIKCFDQLTSINNCYIITQLCTADLDKQLKKKGRFEEKQISKFIYDILKGLQYLQNNSIIHRDLKISNIFLSPNGTAKIADFGFAIKSNQTFKDLSIGSPVYMSPQGLINNIYGPKTDVWALGVLIYQLLHGQAPLDSCKSQSQLKRKVFEPPIFRVNVSNELKMFVQCCMRVNQADRLTISQLLQTPYANRIRSQIQGTKLYKPYSSGYCSTYNSTTQLSSVSHSYSNLTSNLISFKISQQISYSSAVSLVHYCRLIYKTSQRVKSSIISSWLLKISSQLLRCKISRNHTDKQQYQKLKEVIIEYHNKYQKEYKNQNKSQIKFNEIIKEAQGIIHRCNVMVGDNNLNNTNIDINYFISLFLNQTKLLKRTIEKNQKFDNFGKESQSKNFLMSLSNTKNNANQSFLSPKINSTNSKQTPLNPISQNTSFCSTKNTHQQQQSILQPQNIVQQQNININNTPMNYMYLSSPINSSFNQPINFININVKNTLQY